MEAKSMDQYQNMFGKVDDESILRCTKRQDELILKALMNGESFTEAEARERFGCGNLYANLNKLRREGHVIQSRIVFRENSNRKYYKEYFMDPRSESVDGGAMNAPSVVDGLDTSDTALAQNSDNEPLFEDSDSNDVILKKFKRYCDRIHGRQVKITHVIARYLQKLSHPRNRKLYEDQVRDIIDDLKNSRWRRTGAQISFDTDGYMQNGHHRMEACIRCEIPFLTDIAFDCHTDGIYIEDAQIKIKTPADIAKAQGYEENSKGYSAMATVLYRKDKGLPPGAPVRGHALREAHQAYADGRKWASLAQSMGHNASTGIGLKGPTSVLAAILYLCAEINEEKTLQFAKDLKAGANLAANDPVLVARNHINSGRTKFGKDANSQIKYRQWLVKAWDHRLKGRKGTYFKNMDEVVKEWP